VFGGEGIDEGKGGCGGISDYQGAGEFEGGAGDFFARKGF